MLVVAQGPGLFLAGRVLQGLSGSLRMPATLALIKTWYEDVRGSRRSLLGHRLGRGGGSGLCFLRRQDSIATVWAGAGSSSSRSPLPCWPLFCCAARRRAAAPAPASKLDVGGLLSLIVALVLVRSVYQQGPRLGLEQPAVVDHAGRGRWRRGRYLSATACAKARRR